MGYPNYIYLASIVQAAPDEVTSSRGTFGPLKELDTIEYLFLFSDSICVGVDECAITSFKCYDDVLEIVKGTLYSRVLLRKASRVDDSNDEHTFKQFNTERRE